MYLTQDENVPQGEVLGIPQQTTPPNPGPKKGTRPRTNFFKEGPNQ